MEIPPQMMFLHQGQDNVKELRFHPQFGTLLASTAEDSFNIFRPNLDPVEEEEAQAQGEDDEMMIAQSEDSGSVSVTGSSAMHTTSADEESKN